MTKSRNIGRGGARKGAGRKPIYRKFIPNPTAALILNKWQDLGYESQDDLINFALAVIAKELQ